MVGEDGGTEERGEGTRLEEPCYNRCATTRATGGSLTMWRAVVKLDSARRNLSMIPHRRGAGWAG